MKNSKVFLFLFSIGLICIFIAGLSLFLSLNPSLLKNNLQYEVGKVLSTQGYTKKVDDSGSLSKMNKGQRLYSKERFSLGEDSKLNLLISGESIEIFGPSEFYLEVINPESQKVFINFSEFSNVEPKDSFENLHLTYKGWLIEPFFTKEDLKTSEKKEIDLPPITKVEPDDGQTQAPELDKTALLNELIAGKRGLLKRCYENYLRKNPLATGKLIIEFTLENTGKVSASRVKDSSFFKDEAFKSCIQDVFTRIKTSPFEGDAWYITYPIEFE